MSETNEALLKQLETMLASKNVEHTRQQQRLRVRQGSTAVFLKASKWMNNHSIVELVAPVITKVEQTPTLLEKLNELNKTLFFGKAYWHDKTVWLAHNLLGDKLDALELVSAVGLVVTVADKLDDEFKERFGGTRWIDG